MANTIVGILHSSHVHIWCIVVVVYNQTEITMLSSTPGFNHSEFQQNLPTSQCLMTVNCTINSVTNTQCNTWCTKPQNVYIHLYVQTIKTNKILCHWTVHTGFWFWSAAALMAICWRFEAVFLLAPEVTGSASSHLWSFSLFATWGLLPRILSISAIIAGVILGTYWKWVGNIRFTHLFLPKKDTIIKISWNLKCQVLRRDWLKLSMNYWLMMYCLMPLHKVHFPVSRRRRRRLGWSC